MKMKKVLLHPISKLKLKLEFNEKEAYVLNSTEVFTTDTRSYKFTVCLEGNIVFYLNCWNSKLSPYNCNIFSYVFLLKMKLKQK